MVRRMVVQLPMNNGPAYGGAAPTPAQEVPPAMPASPYQASRLPVIEHMPPTPPLLLLLVRRNIILMLDRLRQLFYQPKAGSGRNFVKPIGFHSSSSDKSLQQKYGHSAMEPSPAISPPPSSNGSSYSLGSWNGGGTWSGVDHLPGLNNPYSGGMAALVEPPARRKKSLSDVRCDYGAADAAPNALFWGGV
jgi:hypothetical protein